MRAFLRATSLLGTLVCLQACFVEGESVTGPQFAEVCADSVASDTIPCMENTAELYLEVTYHRYPWETR